MTFGAIKLLSVTELAHFLAKISRITANPPQVKEMDKLQQQRISDLEIFKNSLRAQGAEPMALEYVDEAFGRLAERIKKLAG